MILATWLGDTGAYLVGRSFGRTPLLPAVSPKKTVEGLVGGLVGSMLAGGIGAVLFGLDVPWHLGVVLGLALGVIGQLGDLCESLLKRQAGVKDSGTLIPGHGGMLDRIDALSLPSSPGLSPFAHRALELADRWRSFRRSANERMPAMTPSNDIPSGPTGVAVLGSTGSVGTQTLDVIAHHPDRFRVVALAAGANTDLLSRADRPIQPRPRRLRTRNILRRDRPSAG